MAVSSNFSKQRALIYEIIKKSSSHPTAEQIYLQAKLQLPNIGKATVYRNLNFLVNSKIVRKISLPGESDRYDWIVYEHDHAVCSSCGAIFDVFLDEDNDNLGIRGRLPEGFCVHESSVIISGVCQACRKKNTG